MLDNNEPAAPLDALRDIALFVAVMECGGFSAAARRLGLPASTVSWRIQALEQSLGVRLFNRTTRKVSLTWEGIAQFERCKALASEARSLIQDLRNGSAAARGRLRISTTIDFSTAFLAPILPEFMRRYPEVGVDIEATAQRVDLLAENLDLAIRMGPLPDSGLIVRRLMTAHMNLYASPGYLREHGTPSKPTDLLEHECLKAGAQSGEVTWKLRQGDALSEITVHPRFWANHLSIVRELVLNSFGIAVLVEELYADDIRAGRLVRVLPDWALSTVAVSVVMPQRHLPARTRAFVDFLAEKLPPHRP